MAEGDHEPSAEQKQYLDRFLDPARRLQATYALAGVGDAAIPILAALFSGAAKNQWGVPYQRFGEAVQGGLVTARLLGVRAKALEPLIRGILKDGADGVASEAARTLGAFETLQPETVAVLAARLADGGADLRFEAAATLVRCGAADHPVVQAVRAGSAAMAAVLDRVSTGRG